MDNGSTDESLEQARSYCSRPNFTLIEKRAEHRVFPRGQSGHRTGRERIRGAVQQRRLRRAGVAGRADPGRRERPQIFAVQSLMIRHFDRELADDAGDYVTWMGFACKTGDGRRASRYTKQKRIFSACGGAALYRKSILDEIGNL